MTLLSTLSLALLIQAPTTGLIPLSDFPSGFIYKGEDGGLYGKGRNEPPDAHRRDALGEIVGIVPRDAEGKPSPDGRIVFVSISMSNATQEFSYFKRVADADPAKSPAVTIVDCAQGGQAMAEWAPPNANPWLAAERRIADAGVTSKQVQAAWVKLANKGPSGDLQTHGRKLEADTIAVLRNAKARFPNLRVAYLSSRIYGGYSAGRLNPEPYAYESAFAVRWILLRQIEGDAALNWDSRADVKMPILLWGPYLWADGMNPRKSDGLIWTRDDLAQDGTHPSQSGRAKVANMLLEFFKKSDLAKGWFAAQQQRG
jgi:hypothetical protein